MSRKEDAASLQKIQSEIDECTALLETLRGRFEQYFQGSERIPPDQQRKDLFRRIHHLEHQTLNNTSAKFRLQNLSQKFRSYNEYWSRTLRQIEDGTYSRHVAKAKKIAATSAPVSQDSPQAATQAVAQAPQAASKQSFLDELGDLADDFLATLGNNPPAKPAAKPQAPAPQAPAPQAAPQVQPPVVVSPAQPQPAQPQPAVARPLPVFQKPAVAQPVVAAAGSPADAEAKQLYEQLTQARTRQGVGGGVPKFEDFRRSLERQTQQLQQANPGRKVRFRVIVQDGKPLIQPLIES